MIIKKITFEDFDGNKVTEEHMFHMTKSEILGMEASTKFGLQKYLEKITKEKDSKELFGFFKDIVLNSYGKKSEDGTKFVKNAELRAEFENSLAFDALIMEMFTEEGAADKFFVGIMPKDIAAEVEKAKKEGTVPVLTVVE